MNIKAYNDMLGKIASVYKEAANQSIQNGANGFRFKQQDDRNIEMIDNNFENAIANITVSGDGSWQKRGFDFGVRDAIDEISMRGCKLDFRPT